MPGPEELCDWYPDGADLVVRRGRVPVHHLRKIAEFDTTDFATARSAARPQLAVLCPAAMRPTNTHAAARLASRPSRQARPLHPRALAHREEEVRPLVFHNELEVLLPLRRQRVLDGLGLPRARVTRARGSAKRRIPREAGSSTAAARQRALALRALNF